MADKKGTGRYQKGGTQLLTIRLTSGELNVKVRLLQHRMVFGRSEWKVAPVSGNGSTWIAEASFKGGVSTVSPTEQTTVRAAGGENPPIEAADVERKTFASRRPR